MGSLIGISQPAGFLLDLHILRICGKRKWHYSLIAKLLFHLTIVYSISCDSGRCSSLETEHFNSQFLQRISQIIGCLQSIWTCIIAYITVNTACFQISSSTQNYRLTMVNSAGIRLHTCDLAILYQKLSNLSLADGQVLLILQRLSHFITVSLLISLSTKGMHCRAFGTVQHFGLNKSLINIFSHLTAKSIQFTNQMSLRTSTYIRVTRHQRNTLCAYRKHDRIQSQSRPCQRSLTASMTSTDHYYVIILL